MTNFRVTIEPLSDEAKENIPEPQTFCLDNIILTGQYDPWETSQYLHTKPDDLPPGSKGQINCVMGKDVAEALFQLIKNGLPERVQMALALRMLKDRTGMIETKEIASVVIDSFRGGV